MTIRRNHTKIGLSLIMLAFFLLCSKSTMIPIHEDDISVELRQLDTDYIKRWSYSIEPFHYDSPPPLDPSIPSPADSLYGMCVLFKLYFTDSINQDSIGISYFNNNIDFSIENLFQTYKGGSKILGWLADETLHTSVSQYGDSLFHHFAIKEYSRKNLTITYFNNNSSILRVNVIFREE